MDVIQDDGHNADTVSGIRKGDLFVRMELNMQSWERMVSWNVRIKQGFYMQMMCV